MQTAWTSNATQSSMPSAAWTLVADDGKVWSGVAVARTMRSMSVAVDARHARARGALPRSQGWRSSRLRPRHSGCGCRCARRSIRRWCRRVCASSSLVTRRFGSALPTPSDDRTQGHCGGLVGESVGAEIVEVVADLPGDVVADHAARRRRMALATPFGVGAAVALHHQAVEAEEDRAIVVVGVEVDLQQVERGPRQREAGLRPKRALEGAAQQVGDEARRALGGLERDIAGEAVGDDDVDVAARQLVAFGEAVEAERQVVRLAQQRGGVLELVGALQFLGADVEQLHARLRDGRAP